MFDFDLQDLPVDIDTLCQDLAAQGFNNLDDADDDQLALETILEQEYGSYDDLLDTLSDIGY